jgi:predicted nucleic acid-binding protein
VRVLVDSRVDRAWVPARAVLWWSSESICRSPSGVRVGARRVACDEAAQLEPAELRSLDALHMAAALRLGPALGSMVSYDERVLDAARRHGLAIAHPGWTPTERNSSS